MSNGSAVLCKEAIEEMVFGGKKQIKYSQKNKENCRKIRKLFDNLVFLLENNKAGCFNELRIFFCEMRGRHKNDLKNSGCDFIINDIVIKFIVKNLNEIKKSGIATQKTLEDIGSAENILQEIKDVSNATLLLNKRLVIDVVMKQFHLININNPDIVDDLIQEGMFGLRRAIFGFNAECGFTFVTYASFWIRQSIRRALDEKYGNLIKLPSHIIGIKKRAWRAHLVLEQKLDREPTPEEISVETGFSMENISFSRVGSVVSLNRFVEGVDDVELIETIPFNGISPEENIVLISELEKLAKAMDVLSPREKTMIEARFGLDDFKRAHNLIEIGEMFKITKERVRQIEVKSLQKLRKKIILNKK